MATEEERAQAVEEIRRIILTYPEASDRGDLDRVGEFLGGVLFGEPDKPLEELSSRTPEEASKMYGEAVIYYPDGTSRARHIMTNIDIAVADDGESAKSRTTYLVLQASEGLPLQPICTGGYGDTFAREDGVWKLKVRTEWMNLKGDLSQHVRMPERIHVVG